jgi:hypothetical protein
MASMRRVLFVGAGGSAPFEIPVTGKILPEIVRRLRRGENPALFSRQQDQEKAKRDRFLLEEGLKVLYPGIDFNSLDPNLTAHLPYVTEVLSLVDFLIANNQPARPRLDVQQLGRLRTLFDQALCEVLSSRFAVSLPDPDMYSADVERASVLSSSEEASKRARSEHPLWKRLTGFIDTQIADRSDHLSIITTNYDLLMDRVLDDVLNEEVPRFTTKIDRGFVYREVGGDGNLAYRPAPAGEASKASRLALYKLHGSLNYLRCDACDQVYLNPNGEIAYLAFESEPKESNTCHCGHGNLRHLIVAPSTVRNVNVSQILDVWSAATEALRTAGEWIFVGYSLPSEDLAIRSMLVRAWHARGQIRIPGTRIDSWPFRPVPAVKVVQSSKAAQPAYALLFGKLSYDDQGLEKWLST